MGKANNPQHSPKRAICPERCMSREGQKKTRGDIPFRPQEWRAECMSNSRFYALRQWKEMRERVLRENRYRCQNCSRYGRMRDATTVHHANPIEERPELRLTRWNLVALCDECHNKMHDRTTHKLTELGERWRLRVTPPVQKEN